MRICRVYILFVRYVYCSCQAYLRRFGYYLRDERPTGTSDARIQQLRTHPNQQFTSAVSNFQRFAGLNVTGNELLGTHSVINYYLTQPDRLTDGV